MGMVRAWTYSVEDQKTRMPHIHMLLILEKDHDLRTPKFVDQYISARIPQLPPPDDISPEAIQQRRLCQLVTKMYVHDCATGRSCRLLCYIVMVLHMKYVPKDFKSPTLILRFYQVRTYGETYFNVSCLKIIR